MSCDDQNSISSADAFLVYDLLGAQVFFLCFVLSEKSDFHLHLGKILFLKRGQNQILQQETTYKRNPSNLQKWWIFASYFDQNINTYIKQMTSILKFTAHIVTS